MVVLLQLTLTRATVLPAGITREKSLKCERKCESIRMMETSAYLQVRPLTPTCFPLPPHLNTTTEGRAGYVNLTPRSSMPPLKPLPSASTAGPEAGTVPPPAETLILLSRSMMGKT